MVGEPLSRIDHGHLSRCANVPTFKSTKTLRRCRVERWLVAGLVERAGDAYKLTEAGRAKLREPPQEESIKEEWAGWQYQNFVDAIRYALKLEPLYESALPENLRFLTLPPELPFARATPSKTSSHHAHLMTLR